MSAPTVTDEQVDRVLDAYRYDPEAAHASEDELLAEYVRAMAKRRSPGALRLVRLLDADRDRWYA